jgi:hypothetical protein
MIWTPRALETYLNNEKYCGMSLYVCLIYFLNLGNGFGQLQSSPQILSLPATASAANSAGRSVRGVNSKHKLYRYTWTCRNLFGIQAWVVTWMYDSQKYMESFIVAVLTARKVASLLIQHINPKLRSLSHQL